MKVYNATYEVAGSYYAGETVIAGSVAEVMEILGKRNNVDKSKIYDPYIREIDIERVRINNLHAGDLVRLIKGNLDGRI